MVIVVVGATATGKTKLSIELAKKYNGEVINGDSTQVYKGLDIATAKVTESEKEGIVHHLLDIKNIDEEYTIFDYQKDCRTVIDDIINRGKTPIICGGSNLYIKAALYDYKLDYENKKNDYSNYETDELFNKLIEVDPNTKIHKNNRVRIERSLDYFYSNNKPMSEKEPTDKMLYDCVFIGLNLDRKVLYERIDKRVDLMFENGLEKEAKKLYETGIRSKALMTPIGYRELFEYFDGNSEINGTLDLIKKRSRNYAKRQITWLKHQFDVIWFESNIDNFDSTINEVDKYLKDIVK